MKTILIIEDHHDIARKMAESLTGLGSIVCCTKPKKVFSQMPSLDEVKKMIAEADIVLLDGDLGSTPYKGKDLLSLCEGKKVIGISTHFSFGEVNYRMKNYLTFGDSPENQKFRTLVSSQIQE